MDVSFSYFIHGMATNPMLLITVLLTLGVIFVNGWTDAPNAIATCVTTRCLKPRAAILMSAVFNFLGVLVMTHINSSVASTISNMVDFGGNTGNALIALCAALFSIVVYSVGASFFGIPTSESHSLIAGLTGAAIAVQNSIGGIIECAAYGVPAGIGDPMFDGLENRIARLAFGIPAVKGVDFGAGFAAAYLKGSENNDPYRIIDGAISTESNNAGGILGGISTGMPLIWQMAVKPTPSIAAPQKSVDMDAMQDAELVVHGRHDPCIVPRAVPVAEAVCALALLDALLEDGRFPQPDPQVMQDC